MSQTPAAAPHSPAQPSSPPTHAPQPQSTQTRPGPGRSFRPAGTLRRLRLRRRALIAAAGVLVLGLSVAAFNAGQMKRQWRALIGAPAAERSAAATGGNAPRMTSPAGTPAATGTVGHAAPVRIGVVGPMTGGSADFGTAMHRGLLLAVDEINQVGGYLGRPIELVVRDDQGDPDEGLRVTRELLAQGITAAIGFCNTGVAVRAIPEFQRAEVPLLVPCAAGSPVTRVVAPEESYVFRVSPNETMVAPFVVNDALARGWRRIAVFADQTAYGESGLADVRAALATHGLAPVHVTRFALGVNSLDDAMRAARKAGAQAVLAYTVGPENAVIARSRESIGWDVPLTGPWTLSFPSFIRGAGTAAEGALTAQTFIAEPSNERRAAFLSAYARRFQERRPAVPMAAAQAYDAMYLLMYAMLGGRDSSLIGPAIKARLEDLPRVYYGVVATYQRPFSPQRKDAVTEGMMVMGRVVQGQVTFARSSDARRNLVIERIDHGGDVRPQP